jgi:hypothetical protein
MSARFVILLRGAGAGWKSWSQGIRGLGTEGGCDEIYKSRPGFDLIWMPGESETEVAIQY